MVYKCFDSKVISPDKKSIGNGAKHVNTKITPQNEQLADELHNLLLENLKKEKYIQHLKIIFGALIEQICNY